MPKILSIMCQKKTLIESIPIRNSSTKHELRAAVIAAVSCEALTSECMSGSPKRCRRLNIKLSTCQIKILYRAPIIRFMNHNMCPWPTLAVTAVPEMCLCHVNNRQLYNLAMALTVTDTADPCVRQMFHNVIKLMYERDGVCASVNE